MISLLFPYLSLAVLASVLTAVLCIRYFDRKLRTMRRSLHHAYGHSRKLARQLDHDPLTKCHSRHYFMSRVQDWLDQEGSAGVTLMILDIDHFKSINDSYGHGAGDLFLIACADALRHEIGPTGIVARLGGDEFWVAVNALPPDRADSLADRLRGLMRKVETDQMGTKITRSVSIGLTQVAAGSELEAAMLDADTALYLAKASGRNLSMQTSASLREKASSERAKPTIEGIKQGLADDQFTYFVQPIFDISTQAPHAPLGVEALIRWVRPDGSILLPADFMTTITRHYNNAVKPPIHMANQVAAHFAGSDPAMFCAFNVSSAFLQHSVGTGSDWLENLLAGLNPSSTVLEIVESAVIEDAPKAKSLLSAVREAGVRIALDDFGTGHSNLMRLRDLPVDIVKIDRGFVASIASSRKNTAILKALIGMGADLGFDIIAEGVETEDQLHKLQDLGITQAQGFLLGQPAPLSEWRSTLFPAASHAGAAAQDKLAAE